MQEERIELSYLHSITLGGVADTLEDRINIQKDCERLEKQARDGKITLIQHKYRLLLLGKEKTKTNAK